MARNRFFSLDVGWQALLKDFGLRPEHVLRRAELPEDLLSRGAQEISCQDYFRFWKSLEEEACDPMFPLRLVDLVSADTFSPPLFAALCSANLMQGVQRLSKFKQLVAPMSLEIEVSPVGNLTVSPRWQAMQLEVPPSLEIAEVAFLLRLARLATREPMKALRVTLSKSPLSAYARRYESFFGIAVQQSAHPSITFAAADVWRPFLTVNEGMWRVFEPELRRRLSELDVTATTAERLRAVLLELLPANAATIENAAELLISTQT